MFRDKDFDIEHKLPFNEQALIQDLELNVMFNTMALNDKFLFNVARKVFLLSLKDLDTILYRQNILKDCLKNASIVREIYSIAVEAAACEKKFYYGIFGDYPSSIISSSIQILQLFVGMLKKLMYIVQEHAHRFESDGFSALFSMLAEELDDEYFTLIQNHLKELKFRGGVFISAELEKGNKGSNYTIRKQNHKKQSLIKRIFDNSSHGFTFCISDRDESGARALSELKDSGTSSIANAVDQSANHILSFFSTLKTELAFYVGCLNLQEQLAKKGEPICFPIPAASTELTHYFSGLYDVCLSLSLEQRVVGNNVNANNKELVIITGANQGGKSTFLGSIGLAQLMMQCGMFVPGNSFSSNICSGIFTHYKREEDVTMNSGKLDEELSRMKSIVDNITSNSLLLFNESFAATNEREGSEIARQITCALLERHIKIFFVTHFYEFAHGFYDKNMENTIFLRAERENDGGRTFKMVEGEPLQTSYGHDLYKIIFTKED